ncbi:tyrosine-type recombinase/integrase [Stratiformator vulcanicus]|uniref:Site-specific tyrosine recombinase XerC n=1 Tax=Stratiformator vulcanicus TaxID=2527980 RepID=A0A517R3H0_9PLAN|nr:site-specific integrase [Stratiformator vulcanicus]QDT38407.1 site-specific tyrosine recombinase XerC [Stratiformator vulcanicus]
MASLENRTGYYNVVFRFGGRKFTRSLGTDDEREADRMRANLEQTIRDVKSGRLTVPEDAEIATFLLSDGKLTQAPKVIDEEEPDVPAAPALVEVFGQFFDSLPDGALEDSTIATMKTHRQNLLRILGPDEIIAEHIDLNTLDRYVRSRSREKGQRGRNIGTVTIQKEIATLRRVWRWARKRGILPNDFPDVGDIQMPKSSEKPAFQTYDEITRQIKTGGLSEAEQRELWDSLYLRTTEIDKLLDHVRANARQAFLYPMVVAAAHTGARRSELMRSQVSDIREDSLIIREKKRRKGRQSTRRVPHSSRLRKALDEWLEQHPGGSHTFGITSESEAEPIRPLTPEQAHDAFQLVLKQSRWKVIRGWHCLRHSFISNLASQGVDQRLIDEFVGHTSEEMRRRYRHLLPEVKEAAIRGVFD